MTTRSVVAKRPTHVLRREQEVTNEEDTDFGAGSARTVDMSLLSNETSYVDASGVGHVKVNESMDWSDILPNDSTVHIVYQGSGSNEEVLIIPVNETSSDSTDSSSSGSSGSGSMSGTVIDNLPTGSSDSSSGDSVVVDTASTPTTLVIVACALAVIAIAAIFAVVIYGRRNRRRARAISEDPSHNDEPFIVGDLPHQPAPQLSVLDTDITPDLWVEGQYQYSPNMSRLQTSLNGTAILSDNNTTPSGHRLTVDAYPLSKRGNTQRGNTHRGHTQRGRRDHAALDDISDRSRRGMSTRPVVLYDEDAFEERQTNSSRKYHHERTSHRQPSQQQRQRHRQRQRDTEEQQRMHRRDKYATRRDRR